MITGNKGEWSEIYALFKLLGEGKLFSGDANLNRIEEIFYPIIKIIREETGGSFEYELDRDIVIVTGGRETLRIPISIFSEQAAKLFTIIKESTGVFSSPEIEDFMNSINCNSIKAKSTSKTDIRIVIHDQLINKTVELGFSIKSQLGGDSTLLNAGNTTNFIYQILNFRPTIKEIELINSIGTKSKIKDRINEILKRGGSLEYFTLENKVFKNNLILIDSWLPDILSELIKEYYTSKYSSIKDLTEIVREQNPLNYDISFAHTFYEYKIKKFLTEVALGLMPSKVWTGIYDATGGYLVIKEDGEVLCYNIYNKNQFEDYLYNNTKLETAGSKKHKYGIIVEEVGQLFFKLNLQIRFK